MRIWELRHGTEQAWEVKVGDIGRRRRRIVVVPEEPGREADPWELQPPTAEPVPVAPGTKASGHVTVTAG